MRDDRIVGIVSRADLLRAFAAGTRRSTSGHISERPGVVGEIISAIDARFSHKNAGTLLLPRARRCLRARKLA